MGDNAGLPPELYHDVMAYRKMMGCATKEHPAGGDESGAVNNRFGTTEQW